MWAPSAALQRPDAADGKETPAMPGDDCTQVEPLGRHTLIHGDCIEAMRLMPDASVDA
jgi:hypothetical protein